MPLSNFNLSTVMLSVKNNMPTIHCMLNVMDDLVLNKSIPINQLEK